MMVAESIVELILRRDMFESFKPNRKGNGGYHEEDEEGHNYYGNGSSSNGGFRLRGGLCIRLRGKRSDVEIVGTSKLYE
ncbi:hypothetical protein PVK06_009566 [Gossypium arboreum]|uniref:Uncharacterized protein n=1 Tax=Gossypium arboreum TaxID=29729 RepID=A0ABR0QNX8_GOSAR|nr:hypothetical protein PVK06_009566 [Gossypium arboreum]